MYKGRLEELIKLDEQKIRYLKHVPHANPTFLPVYLTGGIGDAILARTTLDRLRKEGFKLQIYSQHAEAFRYFYRDHEVHKGDTPDFTWALHIDSIARFHFTKNFTGFLLPEHRALYEQQLAFFQENPKIEHLVYKHPLKKHLLTRIAQEHRIDAERFPLFTLGYKNIERSPALPRRPREERYITIHDGYDTQNKNMVSGRCTKTWKWEHWNEVVRKIKNVYPYAIIQLGTTTSRIIDGVEGNLVNKTTITEAFDILSKSSLHIDTDSGMAHAATALGVPTIVLFGPTPDSFYGHISNQNLVNRTSCSGGCFLMNMTWMDKCPIGYQSPVCMDDITPLQVLEAVRNVLA